jgi:hypothetical protein
MNFTYVGSVPGSVSAQHSAGLSSNNGEGWRILTGQDIVVIEMTPRVQGEDVTLSLWVTDPASNFQADGRQERFAPADGAWIVQITELPPRADGSPCDKIDYAITLTGNGEHAPSDWDVVAYA